MIPLSEILREAASIQGKVSQATPAELFDLADEAEKLEQHITELEETVTKLKQEEK